MPVKKSIINKDRFKNLSKISENEDEKEKFHASADAVRKVNAELKF